MKVSCLAFMLAFVSLYQNVAVAGNQLVCIHPVPLTIKELIDKQAVGTLSEEAMHANVDYLTLKYCAVVDEVPNAASSVSLGHGCDMKWGPRLGETVYWATCDEGLKQLSLENINQSLPPEIAITKDIFEKIKGHPFFANPPPAKVTRYRVSLQLASNVSGKFATDNTVHLLHVGDGFVREEATSETNFYVNGMASKTRAHSIEVSAANGLISLGLKSHTSDRFADSNTFSRILAVENLVGHLYPMEVGNAFQYQIRHRLDTNTRGTHSSDETSTRYSCEVVKLYDAELFYSSLKGGAYHVHCQNEITYLKSKSANIRIEKNLIFFDQLGAWIAADPVHSRDRIISNRSVTIVGKNKMVTSGVHVLKEVAFGR